MRRLLRVAVYVLDHEVDVIAPCATLLLPLLFFFELFDGDDLCEVGVAWPLDFLVDGHLTSSISIGI